MRVSTALSILAAAATVTAVTPAPETTGNPAGTKYGAVIKDPKTGVNGIFEIESGANGKGVLITAAFRGLKEGGPFKYHIHEKPVPADGNCTGTGGHLDPYKRTDTPACDNTKPQECETGDLSGKYGNIADKVDSFDKTFTDAYLSTNPSDMSFIGNRSIVIHAADKTRIACANLQIRGGATPTGGVTALPSGGVAPTSGPNGTINTHVATPTAVVGSNTAQKIAGGAGALAFAAAALIL